jgi:hypothetical protein
MTSSRGRNPTRWVRRKASDRALKQPPTLMAAATSIGLNAARLYFANGPLRP